MPGTIVPHPSRPPQGGTTNATIAADLTASLFLRAKGVDAGQTVGDFIAALRQLGITDDMPLASIEYGIRKIGSGRVTVDVEHDGLEIREAR